MYNTESLDPHFYLPTTTSRQQAHPSHAHSPIPLYVSLFCFWPFHGMNMYCESTLLTLLPNAACLITRVMQQTLKLFTLCNWKYLLASLSQSTKTTTYSLIKVCSFWSLLYSVLQASPPLIVNVSIPSSFLPSCAPCGSRLVTGWVPAGHAWLLCPFHFIKVTKNRRDPQGKLSLNSLLGLTQHPLFSGLGPESLSSMEWRAVLLFGSGGWSNHIFFICSSTHGHLGCCHILIGVNNASIIVKCMPFRLDFNSFCHSLHGIHTYMISWIYKIQNPQVREIMKHLSES